MFDYGELTEEDIVVNVSAKPKAATMVGDEDDDIKVNVYNRKRRKFSDSEKQEMLKRISYSCVNDFGDEYHLTDEQRESNAELRQVKIRISSNKSAYNKIVPYILAMRNVIDAIDVVTKYNNLFRPEDFKKKVYKGKIVCPGIPIPKYKGKRKYNMEYVAEVILDRSLDPHEVFKNDNSYIHSDVEYDLSNPEELEQYRHSVFTDAEYDMIFNTSGIEVYAKPIKKKERKEFDKKYSTMVECRREFKRTEDAFKRERMLNTYAYDAYSSIENDYNSVSKYDKRRIKGKLNIPQFKGDIMNPDDYKQYMYSVQQWAEENIRDDRGRKLSDIEESDVRALLEESGWNVKKMLAAKIDADEVRSSYKLNQAKEEAVKKRLIEASNGVFSSDVKKKKKKKKKKHKSINVIAGGKKISSYDEEFKETIDDHIKEIIPTEYDDFDEYASSMLDFTSDSIFK